MEYLYHYIYISFSIFTIFLANLSIFSQWFFAGSHVTYQYIHADSSTCQVKWIIVMWKKGDTIIDDIDLGSCPFMCLENKKKLWQLTPRLKRKWRKKVYHGIRQWMKSEQKDWWVDMVNKLCWFLFASGQRWNSLKIYQTKKKIEIKW